MKSLWRRFRFYAGAFVMGTALPIFGAYLAADKYGDPKIFPVGAAAVLIFAVSAIVIAYVCEQRESKASEDS